MFLRINILIFCVLSINCAFAGAWTKSKGEGYNQLGFSNIYSKGLHSNFGEPIQLKRDLLDLTFQEYLEYGITDKITFIAYVPFKVLSTGEKIYDSPNFNDTLPSGKLNGFGNVTLSALISLAKTDKMALSFEPKMEMNSGKVDYTTGLRTAYSAWGFAPSFHLGFNSKDKYLTTRMGAIYRTNNYSSALTAGIEGGKRITKKMYFIVGFDFLKSLYNGTVNDETVLQTGMYVNNQEYVAFNLKMSYDFTKNLGAMLITSGGFFANGVERGLFSMATVYYKWGQPKTT